MNVNAVPIWLSDGEYVEFIVGLAFVGLLPLTR